jgi:hypothetical protein
MQNMDQYETDEYTDTEAGAEPEEAQADDSMDVSDLVRGKFLKKDVIEAGDEVEYEITDVGWTTFKDDERPRVQLTLDDGLFWALNISSTRTAAKAWGTDARQWIGRQVIAWHDDSVTFNGHRGALRLRIPKSER